MDKATLEGYTVAKLKDFLRRRGRPTSAGKKAKLLELAVMYKDEPEIGNSLLPDPDEAGLNEARKVFDLKDLDWKDIENTRVKIPKQFSMKTIVDFLTFSMFDPGDGDLVQGGTEKPSTRGRELYLSRKFQLCEVSTSGNDLLVRGTCEASMKQNDFRYPCAQISASGSVTSSRCTCKAQADGKCAHVGALLYLLEEVSMGEQPRLSKPCTSKPQTWGQGIKTNKDPKPLSKCNYGKKRFQPDSLIHKDPRAKKPSPAEKRARLDQFIRDIQFHEMKTKKRCSWSQLLRYYYEDCDADDEEKSMLDVQCCQVLQNFADTLMEFTLDPLSNDISVHVTGSEEQAACEKWLECRKLKITASILHHFNRDSASIALVNGYLWEPPDLSDSPAIRYGNQHEQDALEAAKKKVGDFGRCGLFLSRQNPWFGGSPDGLKPDHFTVEVKCPLIMKQHKPGDLDKLTKTQKANYCLHLVNDQLQLKKSHPYFTQVQAQMHLCDVPFCYFVV